MPGAHFIKENNSFFLNEMRFLSLNISFLSNQDRL